MALGAVYKVVAVQLCLEWQIVMYVIGKLGK